MIAAWLRHFFRYAALSDGSLRTLRAAYEVCGVFPAERDAITLELSMRSWAAFVEAHRDRTIAWCRGGVS